MQWVILIEEFTQLHTINSVRRFGYNVGLDEFLDLDICGIDKPKIMGFSKNMDDNDTVSMTNH